jgi:glycosyltransferase involved in cell wall biosynthesis
MNSISVSIPAYNDEETILELINESREAVLEFVQDYEIVVINDGSQDSTGEILEEAKSDKVRVYQHAQNEGFGRTIREVFTLPTKEWVFFIPGDAQISPAELEKFYSFCSGYDLLLGWRKNRQDPFFRKAGSWIYNLIISVIALKRIHDVNSVAFFRREIIDSIAIKSQGAFIHAEICLNLLKAGYRIKEIDILHKPRISGTSGAISLKVISLTLRDMLFYISGGL